MRIANNVEMLEIKSEQGTLYPILVWDDNDVVLVDTGMPGQLDLLKQQITNAGFAVEQITKIIFTHQDIDHIGCGKEIIELSSNVETLAHSVETSYIDGKQPPIKLASMDKSHPFYPQFKAGFDNRRISISKELHDGDILPYCGGIEVIHTPGHTPGHISLLLKDSNILIAGDAANIQDGQVIGANPQHTQDMLQAEKSFRKMMDMKPATIICYHGGIFHL